MQPALEALRKERTGKTKHLTSTGKPSPKRGLVNVTQQALVKLNQVDLFNIKINGTKSGLIILTKNYVQIDYKPSHQFSYRREAGIHACLKQELLSSKEK